MAGTVIVLTERRLFPERAGTAARINALIRALRELGYRVVLIAPKLKGRLSPLLPAIASTLRTRRSVDHLISVTAAPFAPGALTYDCAPFRAALASAVRQFDPVAVLAEYCWMAPCLDAVTNGALTAVDTLDLMHVRLGLYGSIAGGAWVVCDREEEARALDHADVVIAIQRHEQREFEAMLPGKRVLLVPHICWPVRQQTVSDPERDVVAFIGSRNDGNVLGLQEFLRDGWPVVRRSRPTAELRVYGDVVDRLPPATLGDGVHLVGFTRSVETAYREAVVVINPVRIGTGLKIKTLEAMAFGKTVVTTSCGAAGLEEAAHHAYALEDDMAAFGTAVGALLADPERRTALERRATEFVDAHFSPREALRELVDSIERHRVARGRRPRAVEMLGD